MTIISDDGWDSIPQETGGLIRGQIIKFANGIYAADKLSIMNCESIKWEVLGVLPVWIRWQNNAPVEYKTAEPGGKFPNRDDLSHLDQEKWPFGHNSDERQDPWRNCRYLYLLNTETGTEATFITETIGGRKAIAELKDAIKEKRRVRPRAIPIIRLTVEQMHTAARVVAKPSFKIPEWKDPDRDYLAPTVPKRTSPLPNEAALPRAEEREDLNDLIPF